jgi:hypothetical protein
MKLDEDFSTDEYEVKLLLSKPQFHNDILSLRSKWNIPPEGYSKNKEWNAWHENLSEEKELKLIADLYKLINKYQLSERWTSPLKQFLLDNVHTRLRATSYTAWKFDYEGETSNPKNIQAVWIKVDADTTERELKDAFKKAKEWLPPKRKKQAYTYLDHALKARELRNTGLKWSVVAERLNNEFKTNYEENYVVKLVKRLESHL